MDPLFGGGPTYSFGTYALDPESLELTNGDEVVEIEPQVFSLLVCLIENRDRVMSKDELIEQVWDGRIVSDGTLNTRINAARKAVGDDGKAQAVIKTFPRRGFRWVAELNGDGGETEQPTVPNGISDKPSIAVLPFENLSNDPEQDYFSDGIAEDIITGLSRIHSFLVIARNSTFAYKGKAVDVQEIAAELGVSYVLEGSVRKAGDRVRISVQLIDGATATNMWAEQFDRVLEDIFAVQDEITRTVVGTIEPTLSKAERDRAVIRSPENLHAWDYYQRGFSHLFDRGEFGQPGELVLARENFLKSIDLDPTFSRPYAGLAHCHYFDILVGHTEDASKSLEKGFAAARKAISLDDQDAYARGVLSHTHWLNRDPDAAIRECHIAIEIEPSYTRAYFWLGISVITSGNAQEGIGHIDTALRIGSRDPSRGPAMAWKAFGHLFLSEFATAAEWARNALSLSTTQIWGNVVLVSALGHLENKEEAKRALETLFRRKPIFSISFVNDRLPVTDPGYMEILVEGLRKAGVPEK